MLLDNRHHSWAINTIALVASVAAMSCDESESPLDADDGGRIEIRYQAISASWLHTCALSTDGAPYCWGAGSERPLAVEQSPVLQSITAGFGFTCGLTSLGHAYCWGTNSQGQLGNGTQEKSSVPVRTAPNLTFTLVDAGGQQACGLTPQNEAYCWGNNQWGQLGNGLLFTSELNPVPVSGDLTFSTISVGESHTCGITIAGQGYCWGLGRSAQIGDGTDSIRTTPTQVASSEIFESISAGGDIGHTCATSSGGLIAYCWGDNQFGQLGDTESTSTPCRPGLFCLFFPTPVMGAPSLQEVEAGWTHTCGLTREGTAYCWGAYALGNGEPAVPPGSLSVFAPPGPQPRPVVGGHSFTSITAGHNHTCAVSTDGVAYCWGLNLSGVLGGSTLAEAVSPVRVLEPMAE